MSSTTQFYDCACHPYVGLTNAAWADLHNGQTNVERRTLPAPEYARAKRRPSQPKVKRRPAVHFSGVETSAYLQEMERQALEEAEQQIQDEVPWLTLIDQIAKQALAKESRRHQGQFGHQMPLTMEPHELANAILERLWPKVMYASPLDPSTWDRPSSMTITEDGWAQCAVAYVWDTASSILADHAGSAAERNQATTSLDDENLNAAAKALGAFPSAEDIYLEKVYEIPFLPVFLPATRLDSETGEPVAPRQGREDTYGSLRCGQHQGTSKAIKIHQRAKEPLCESSNPWRWASIKPNRIHRLTCADWDWYRYVKKCPTCGYWFKAPHQRIKYCQMPCQGE